jgi:hypothetical protein
MPSVELSQQTYDRLLRRTKSFSDTAEQVIARLLDETVASEEVSVHKLHDRPGEPRQTTSRATPGSILPEREYWYPILEVIAEAGGAAASSHVIDALGERMQGLLKPRDYELLAMGEIRWRNRARFARLRMTEQGLLSKPHRGIWEITDAGRKYLEERKD